MTDYSASSAGKGQLNGVTDSPPHRPAGPVVAVQPPRREDLQPSYAKVLRPDTEDESAHGWYGNMIECLGSAIGALGAVPCCICCPSKCNQTPWTATSDR